MRKFFLYISLMVSALISAQTLPYECSFEESEDLSNWHFNAGSASNKDKWIVGTATHSTGKRSLYISSDGVSPIYGAKPNVSVSYLSFDFPTDPNPQNYDVSFDWVGMGDVDKSHLRVIICPESALSSGTLSLDNIASDNSGVISSDNIEPKCMDLGSHGRKACGSATWINVSIPVTVRSNSPTYAIVFIWENNNTDTTVRHSSIAIDNVQIASNKLRKPTNLEVIPACDSTLALTWEAASLPQGARFEVGYRLVGLSNWITFEPDQSDGLQKIGTYKYSYTISDVLEGAYDVRVRVENGNLTTNYTYSNSVFLYCPENHCVNYARLDASNVKCAYGHHPDYEHNHSHRVNEEEGIVDFGPAAMESRHTVHVDPTETDPRTGGELYTVPKGALASVRLGNWGTGAEAESITYEIDVDSASYLLVQYAVVLQEPGHPGEPEFKLEVLDENGQLINHSMCGQADFTYTQAYNDPHWKTFTHEGSSIVWKNWTTIGVDLSDYYKNSIQVRFTTMDCTETAHYGYAYFTVDCASATIKTNNCGKDPYLSCYAPKGFKYEWTDEQDSVVGRERELEVPATPQSYTCKLTFLENDTCYFTISTYYAPRFPVPDYKVDTVFEDCTSLLKFTNKSHVMYMIDGVPEHKDSELCEACHWQFRSITKNTVIKEDDSKNPTCPCPLQGDSIEITLTAYVGADNHCDSVRVDTIVVPNILTPDSIRRVDTCSINLPVSFDGKLYYEDTIAVHPHKNIFGCDSLLWLYLNVYPDAPDRYIHDSICSDSVATIAGFTFNEPIVNHRINLETVHGCDSIIFYTLTVNERLQATVDRMPYACADDEQLYVSFDIAAGVYDSLEIRFNTPELRDTMIYDPSVVSVSIPYPSDIAPGHYQATIRFHQFCCGIYEETRDFDIRFRSSIVEQKWNDVLTLLSPKANGGFEFTAFQWYKDDAPLLGETKSYLYQPLDMDATYYVELTQPDGSVVATCPIQPVYHEQQTAFPTIVSAGQHLPMYMEHSATIWYYTISGQLYTTFSLPQGYTSLSIPGQSGSYIVKSVNSEGETQAQVMIVQ
ncbi:MAG: fibronectin type III domain-containing protein [Paludibacteraceae bacterium]|nr:fibronectin type III domain-containing protein [Paludibacteraceae bacterium]